MPAPTSWPTASGSRISSIPPKKNYGSQNRWSLDRYKTPDLIQGKVLAVLPWEGGCKTETVASYASLSEDITRRALEDLIRRGMVTIDDRNHWRKKSLD